MKKSYNIGLLAFCVCSFLFLAGFKTGGGELRVTDSPEGRFKVMIPAGYNITNFTVITDFGPVTNRIYTYESKNDSDDNLKYVVSYGDYPDSVVRMPIEMIRGIVKKAAEQYTANNGINLVSKTSIKKGDFDFYTIEGTTIGTGNLVKAEFCFLANRLYMAETITASKNKNNLSIKVFFDSFNIQP